MHLAETQMKSICQQKFGYPGLHGSPQLIGLMWLLTRPCQPS
jgi:hypothetical protein